MSNLSLREYFQEEEELTRNKGYINGRKVNRNIRTLVINPNRCKPNDVVKMNHLQTALMKYEIVVVIMNETITK